MNAVDLEQLLSDASRGATRSEIRELLKLAARPGIISLGGGMPPPEAFPVDDLVELLPSVLLRHGASALQYGPTEGDLGLRESLIRFLVETEGEAFARLTPEHLLVTSASQQGLDLCGRVFITPGDTLVCELPSYLGALSAFRACDAQLCGIPLDGQGLRTDLLEKRLALLRRRGIHPKFVYTVPDFQNPTGVTLGLARRKELLSIAREFDLLVVEDSPYRPLRYAGQALPTLASLDRDGRVVSLFTFSKILSPGLRLGWIVADPAIISRLVVAKQSVDLCTSGLSQLLGREYLRSGRLPAHVDRLRKLYAGKCEVLSSALAEHVDPAWGVSWTRPAGGLFVWLEGPSWMDAGRLCERALERDVAFVAGRAFHCDGSGRNTFRLNFSYPSADQLGVAVGRLVQCIGDLVHEHAHDRDPHLAPGSPVEARM